MPTTTGISNPGAKRLTIGGFAIDGLTGVAVAPQDRPLTEARANVDGTASMRMQLQSYRQIDFTVDPTLNGYKILRNMVSEAYSAAKEGTAIPTYSASYVNEQAGYSISTPRVFFQNNPMANFADDGVTFQLLFSDAQEAQPSI